MLKVLILICPIAMDHFACQPDTATDTIRTKPVASAQECAFMGQAALAPTALVPDPSKFYVKIMCVREREAKR